MEGIGALAASPCAEQARAEDDDEQQTMDHHDACRIDIGSEQPLRPEGGGEERNPADDGAQQHPCKGAPA